MNNLTVTCRDFNQLNGLVKVMLELALEDIKKQGVNPLVVETYRSQERQDYLYCQGRTVVECTAKGISRFFAEMHCNPKAAKVTWTLSSVHKNRKAVDVVPQRLMNNKMTAIWDAKDKETQIIIRTMQKYGFEAGANWATTPDSPHFQVTGNFDNIFERGNNNPYVTKAIQQALNSKINAKLVVDGKWGPATDNAVSDFRKKMKYKSHKAMLGAAAFKDLFS